MKYYGGGFYRELFEGTETFRRAFVCVCVCVFASLHQCEEKITTSCRNLLIVCDCWKKHKTVSKEN